MPGGWERSTANVCVHTDRRQFIHAVRDACRDTDTEIVEVFGRAGPGDCSGIIVVDLHSANDTSVAEVTDAIDGREDPIVLVGGVDVVEEAADQVDGAPTFPLPIDGRNPPSAALTRSIEQAIEWHTLREERDRYRLMAETVPDGVYILDSDFVYRYVNEAFAEILGYDREELMDAPLSKIHDEEGVAAAQAARRRALDRDDPIETTYNDHITADGERIPCEVQFRAITDDSGELIETVGVLRNITERLERERELKRHNERLRHFSRIVSHDIRSPLTVAQGNIELGMETDDPERHLEKATTALERLEDIVTDLLTLAREGSSIDEPQPVDIGEVAREATLVVDTTDATVDIDTDGRAVMGERKRLRRLFENLFRNTIEHAGVDATVRVGALPDGFYVEDNGPGIPAEERDRVFEVGYTSATDGTGYGLNIVEEIAATHGMAVRIEEGELGGARFEIREEAPTTDDR